MANATISIYNTNQVRVVGDSQAANLGTETWVTYKDSKPEFTVLGDVVTIHTEHRSVSFTHDTGDTAGNVIVESVGGQTPTSASDLLNKIAALFS